MIKRLESMYRRDHRWCGESFSPIGKPFVIPPSNAVSRHYQYSGEVERRMEHLRKLGVSLDGRMKSSNDWRFDFFADREKRLVVKSDQSESEAHPFIMLCIREDRAEFEALYTVVVNAGESREDRIEEGRLLCREAIRSALQVEVCQHCGTVLLPQSYTFKFRERFSCLNKRCIWKTIAFRKPSFPRYEVTGDGAFASGGMFNIGGSFSDVLAKYYHDACCNLEVKKLSDDSIHPEQWINTLRIQTSSMTW